MSQAASASGHLATSSHQAAANWGPRKPSGSDADSTLEKLIEIDTAAAGKPRPAQSRKMRDLRDQLAQRIEQLKRA
jgi:hypothetical protein